MGTDFIRAPSKASLLAMLKSAREIDPRLLRSLFDGVIFKSEMINYLVSGGADHGELSGLTGDDHLQYLLVSNTGDTRSVFATNWTDLTDTGETTLHTHANIGDGPWLPLAGGDVTGATTFDDGIAVDTIAEQNADTGVTVDSLLIQDGNIAAVDYSFVTANDGATDVTAAELEELTDASTTILHTHDHSHNSSSLPFLCFSNYVDIKARNAVYSMHGGLHQMDAGSPLDTDPTDIVVDAGSAKIMVVVNAGGDLDGEITVTGTTVDRDTGAETGADTDTLTVDALTIDDSDTDASGNARYSFTGAYITSKWFKGSVTLSTVDLTLTDVDTYCVAFEQFNDAPIVTITTLDITAKATNANAWMYSYLYTLEVTADKCDITRIASLELPAADVTADVYYRLRRGTLNTMINGTTDGIWLDVFPGPLASAYWEDMNFKVWATIKTSGETTGPPVPPGIIGTLVTPVYHHWNGETPGALPSHSAKPSSMLALEISTDHPLNWTHSAWGPTAATTDGLLVDLGGTFGSADSGVRVVTLQRMNGTAQGFYEDGMNSSGADVYGDNYIRWQIAEVENPDDWNHVRVIGGVTDFAEDYTGHGQNNSTGNAWRYVFFEQLAAGNTTWSVYDEAGALQYTGSRAYQGGVGVFPTGLQYLQIIGFNAGTQVAQIWIGRSTDAWPSLPMTPMTNL